MSAPANGAPVSDEEIAGWIADEQAGAKEPDWVPPTPLDGRNLPPFPTNVLPQDLRDFVAELSTATQTPPDLAALLSLSACAAALAKRVVVEARPGWREPINLFVLVSLPPASRKSAVFQEVQAPLSEFERREVERMAPAIEEALTRRTITERAREQAIAKAAKAIDAEQSRQAREEADRLARELVEHRIPASPQLIVSDVTAERLASILEEQGGRVALLSPEGGPFALMAGRYSNGPNFEVFLKGHAGDDLRVDRKQRKPEYVRSPSLTVGLAVQPEVVRSLAECPGFRGCGLLGRFLYAIPASNLGHRVIDPPPLSSATRNRYQRCLYRLLDLEPSRDDQGQAIEHAIRLSPEARQRIMQFAASIEPLLGDTGELATLRDWGGKLAGAVVRLSGIIHAVGSATAPWERAVSAEAVEAAIAIGRYLIPHAHAAYAVMGEDGRVEDARHLLRWIRRERVERFTVRDAHRANAGTLKRSEHVDEAIRLLEVHGYLRAVEQERRDGPGRRPSPAYEVNPLGQY